MIHHMGVFASDHATSRRFYHAALQPLGITLGYESDGVSEFWHRHTDTPSLSLERADELCTQDLHVAFTADPSPRRFRSVEFHVTPGIGGHRAGV